VNTPHSRAWGGLAGLVVVLGLLLFVPAGSFHYQQAWLYLILFSLSAGAITRYLMEWDPALLARRVRGGPFAEKEPSQRFIMLVVSLAYVAIFLVSALDHRFTWSAVPPVATVAGDVLVVAGFYIEFLVFRENTFASATIEVNQGQVVISSGPYAVVRHPMYGGALLMLLGTPAALGSWWGYVPFIAMVPALIWRLLDEERLLAEKLPGYVEYCATVRWRLIPGIL
jgi:protein-S-isoprenylcysteine O-methyltransferase Ste14